MQVTTGRVRMDSTGEIPLTPAPLTVGEGVLNNNQACFSSASRRFKLLFLVQVRSGFTHEIASSSAWSSTGLRRKKRTPMSLAS